VRIGFFARDAKIYKFLLLQKKGKKILQWIHYQNFEFSEPKKQESRTMPLNRAITHASPF
jgi:hypothetical protein